ncbi:hypothetical protein scyTo_0010051 [Scyliorhinus torazame]|uniref:Ig-like domain-containing protein n=1 Tax=Scyliorhinus torazame TaxID=75743 RepID=A0A401NZ34_SCYTO|nr:hypothetical protein [Scyliorhinus torazame]
MMTGRNIAFIGLLHLALFTAYGSARGNSFLSCSSSHSGHFVILDCYYRGGIPFPTLTWTGPNNLYRETANTPRFTINLTQEEFENKWSTIYKCTAGHAYLTSYCYIGRGIGSYVGISFGVLALLFLLCILIIVIWTGCGILCEKIARYRGKDDQLPATSTATGHYNPAYEVEHVGEAITPE